MSTSDTKPQRFPDAIPPSMAARFWENYLEDSLGSVAELCFSTTILPWLIEHEVRLVTGMGTWTAQKLHKGKPISEDDWISQEVYDYITEDEGEEPTHKAIEPPGWGLIRSILLARVPQSMYTFGSIMPSYDPPWYKERIGKSQKGIPQKRG